MDEMIEMVAGSDWSAVQTSDRLRGCHATSSLVQGLFAAGVELVTIAGSTLSPYEWDEVTEGLDPTPRILHVLLRVSLDESVRRAQSDPGRVLTRNPDHVAKLAAAIDWATVRQPDLEVETDDMSVTQVVSLIAGRLEVALASKRRPGDEAAMRATRIAWAPYRIPFVTPYQTAHGTATHRVGFIVRLETDTGFHGLGEADLDPSRPEQDVESIHEPLDALAHALLAASPDEYHEALEAHLTGDDPSRAAHCAVETALADAGGHSSGTSLAKMLAEQFAGEASIVRDRVPVNATIAHQRTEAAAHAALLAVAAGFSCIKLKVGMEPSIDAEVERVETIRRVIGPDMKLRLDANGAWDEAKAIATIGALEPLDIELIEQPVAAKDIYALDRVRAAVTTAIAADEAIVDFETAQRAIQSADAVVLKPMRLGGASVTRYLAQFAAAAGLGVTVTTTIDTGVGTAMALHVAASLLDDGRAHGLATASLLRHDLLAVPLAVERGMIYLPTGPGLGVELDHDAISRYLGDWREVT